MMEKPLTLKEALRVIKKQDQMIGELTRKVDYLQDSVNKREEWLRKAKKDAGYNNAVSFDTVWAETLAKANKT